MKRYLPILILILCAIAAYASGITDWLTLDNLKLYRHQIKDFVAANPLIAPLSFICLYIAIAALSIPVGIYLTFASGFLFPQPWCTLYVIIGATLGASLIFLAAKTALQDILRRKATPFLASMEDGFQQNAVSYMLFLRLIPAFPFWLVNIAPALFNIPFFTFFWTTAIGMIPATFVFTQIGAGLGAIFDNENAFSVQTVLNRDVKIALVALGIFALLPVFYNFRKKRKTS